MIRVDGLSFLKITHKRKNERRSVCETVSKGALERLSDRKRFINDEAINGMIMLIEKEEEDDDDDDFINQHHLICNTHFMMKLLSIALTGRVTEG